MNAWSAGESSRAVYTTIGTNQSTEEPVSRSRTNFFLSIRSSSIRPSRTARRYSFVDDSDPYDRSTTPDEENQRLLPGAERGGPSSPHASSTLINSTPPVWIDLSNQVQDILSHTRSKIAVLDKLHAKHALPGFADRSVEEREIESMTTDITRDFRKCQTLIQQITPHAASSSSFPPSKPSRHQVLTAQNVQRGLAAKVQDLSGAFRKKQRVYMQKLQGHAIKNQDLLIASGAVSLKGSDSVKALEEDVEASRSQLKTQQQSQELLIVAPDIAHRTHEITEIARSIASLAELFKDLSNLVIDQGTILDSVEYNIEQTTVHVQEAAKELQVATRYQKNTGRRKCIFLLLLIIFGLILVLIFKPRRRSAPVATAPVSTAPASATDLSLRFRRDSDHYGRMFDAVWL